MKFIALFALIALVSAADYTIFYYSDPSCSPESYVDQRGSTFGECENFFYDNRIDAEAPCATAIQCLHDPDGHPNICNDVFSAAITASFGGDPVGVYAQFSEEPCSPNREIQEIELRLRTCAEAPFFQGCFAKIVLDEDLPSSESASSTLVACTLLFSALAALLI